MVQGGWNLARWEKYTEIPLAVGALLFLIGYAIQILFDISDGQILALDVLLIGLWMLFGIDYFVSWYLAENRSSWFWRHVHLLLMLIAGPAPAATTAVDTASVGTPGPGQIAFPGAGQRLPAGKHHPARPDRRSRRARC
ncbi:hypothetical protein ODZ83_03765 [Acaricomes phytoseiuli]|uniref:hypothetical protein n=1 Tax=Acaricomes phytoseiuli TaxID=291968 RepID=UPI0022230C25|nr:hypothetical protein [Acaricomes phytoseiuli]MCW1249312.1 hypothetical protein [Acaricomes phytoseiuli]